jgi:aspartate/methionine/tyrosine aminotransferase
MTTITEELFAASNAVGATDVIDLSGDDLSLSTALHIREAAKRALDEGATHYTTRPGLDPLREAVARKLGERNGIQVDPQSDVIITSGTQEALFIALHVLLEPDDEAIVLRPSRPAYVEIVRAAGGVVKEVNLIGGSRSGGSVTGIALDPERLARRVTSRTRVLVLGSPLVPAGIVPTQETLQALTRLAVERNLAVIADEAYEPFVYDGATHCSIGSLPGMAERTITINGFSQGYAMKGWRVGYMAGPQRLIASMMKLKQALSICSAAVSQYAALAALTGPQTPLEEAQQLVARRREVARAALDRARISYLRSPAGFHLLLAARNRNHLPVNRLAEETGVLLAPGSRFGAPSRLRLSLTQEEEEIEEAVRRLRPFLGRDGGSDG